MTGGTLMVSRAVKLFPDIQKRLAALGFQNVEVTGEEKDSLNFIINEKKPRLVLVGAGFYQGSTPYMMRGLLRAFPWLNIAAVSVGEYPDELAMWFIINGVKSYVSLWGEGVERFRHGLRVVREGKAYVAPQVLERIELRRDMPEPCGSLTARHIEVVRLIANGYTTDEIAGTLYISPRTVDTHKTDLYTVLNVRNEKELIRVALRLGLITDEELIFFGRDYQLNPKPEKRKPGKPQTLRRVK